MTLGTRRVTLGVAGLAALASLAAGIAATRRDSLSLLVLAGLAGLALVIVFERLDFGTLVAWVIVTGLVYPVLSTGATGGSLSFDRLAIAGMASWLVLRPNTRQWSPAARWMGLALAWLTVSFGIRAALTTTFGATTVADGDPQVAALNTWIDAIVLPVILFVVVARFANTLERCRQLAAGMAVAGATLGALGVLERIAGFQLATLSGGAERVDVDTTLAVVRTSGPFSVPEVYAVVLLACLAVTLWWTLERGPASYHWGLLAVGLELAGLGVTLFRAAWLGAIIILVTAFGLRPRRAMHLAAVSFLVGVTALFGYLAIRGNTEVEGRLQNTQNIDGRLATYEQAFKVVDMAPVGGVGIGQFANAQPYVPVTSVNGVEAVQSPHSSFLGLLGEQGLIGLLPLLACVLAAWRLLAELRRFARANADLILWGCLVGASLAYLIMSLTLTMLPYGPSNAFFALALGLAAARTSTLWEQRRAGPIEVRSGADRGAAAPQMTGERWLLLAGDTEETAVRFARRSGAEPIRVLTREDLGISAWRAARALGDAGFDRAVIHSRDWKRQSAPQLFLFSLAGMDAPSHAIADEASGELREVKPIPVSRAALAVGRDLTRGAGDAVAELRRSRRRGRSVKRGASAPAPAGSVLAVWVGEPRDVGGSISHISGVLDGFRNLGLRVGLVTTSQPPQQLLEVIDDLEVADASPAAARLMSEFQRLADNAAVRAAGSRLLERMQPTFVYQRHRPFLVAGMDVAAEAAVPLVLEWNTSEVWKRRNWEPTGPLDRLFDRSLARMERSVVSNADLVVAVSARAAEMAVECGAPKERVATVPNAVPVEDIAVARPAPGGSVAKGVGTVGWIGTFGPWHGAEVLIKALEHLGPGVRLRMIGDGVGRQKCVQLAEQLGVAERIEWTGVLPHDEALAALGACDVLASPHVQLDDRPFFGSPIKIFEYMGLGRPIVASRLEQLDEVLEDDRTGRLVTPGDPRELASAIEEILAMPDRGNSLGAAALEEARRSHTWDRRASAILGALKLEPPELPVG